MTRGRFELTYPNGARVCDDYGYLTVIVPNRRHHSRTRSDALKLARSVWGPDVFIVANIGAVYWLGDRMLASTRYSISAYCQSDYDAAVKRGRAAMGGE